jgi:hypothetical protein
MLIAVVGYVNGNGIWLPVELMVASLAVEVAS